jgi:hypothetical protein
MQRKKNIRLLISLCTLCMVTVGVWVLLNRNENITVDKQIFRTENLKSINKIILEKAGKKTQLTFDGGRWKVNEALADRDMVDVLFATIQQAEPKRPVSNVVQDSIGSMLNREGVHVTLFQDKNVELEFVAGGNATKTQAYFKKPGDNESYIMIIPGYRVYTSGIFELDETGWKDKRVFNFNWRNFQSLKVSFPSNPENTFEISMGKEYFEVKGIDTDTSKVNDFLDAISLLTVDQYQNKAMVSQDTLTFGKPGIGILVSDISGKSYSLALFPQPDKQQISGLIQGDQPALFDVRKVVPLVKTKSWFVKKGS